MTYPDVSKYFVLTFELWVPESYVVDAHSNQIASQCKSRIPVSGIDLPAHCSKYTQDNDCCRCQTPFFIYARELKIANTWFKAPTEVLIDFPKSQVIFRRQHETSAGFGYIDSLLTSICVLLIRVQDLSAYDFPWRILGSEGIKLVDIEVSGCGYRQLPYKGQRDVAERWATTGHFELEWLYLPVELSA